MTRVPLVAGNWKMNRTVPESLELVRSLLPGIAELPPPRAEVALLPPFTSLWAVSRELDGSGVELGAQDLHWEKAGAFTGEVSPGMLTGWCRYALVGHSERRTLFHESDEDVNRKALAALAAGLRPMVAVGETLDENEAGRTEEVLSRQVPAALAGMDGSAADLLVMAYEPIWAIGTGRTATADHAQSSCALIRGLVGSAIGAEAATRVRVLYGGSVTPVSAPDLMAQPDVDGGLVGGASLVPADFLAIVAAASARVAGRGAG